MDGSRAPRRLKATAGAAELLRRLGGVHGPLMMHQSGGCCDGSAPMCYPDGEFIVGDRDVLLGVLDLRLDVGETAPTPPDAADAVPVWISGSQFEAWKHTQLILDVVPGRGAGFSLESPEGLRFLSRARAFTPEENALLAAEDVIDGEGWERGRRYPASLEPQIVSEAVDACPVPQSHADS
ncbi:DUF779 domain-containing protein [Rhodococcus spongiicola]|uniref:DUF779 domain-containing protein n=1 Tax=Rhodococcus spongiicola TaxID=2487352 RepID=A0A3S3CN04_9NOCA|nr:DUF779 domain-containing protein [Rhodococcus spongiicola]RVW01466.1 DUF779 domain-containing protein [Rhodococcus spongiicola]